VKTEVHREKALESKCQKPAVHHTTEEQKEQEEEYITDIMTLYLVKGLSRCQM